ncbi:hypothetical protein BOW75_gp27 [Salmonella phage IME207]|uniref:Uncharacterized protein n=1 Tax=Salmonella phage IME207 TaxID=1873985 RepID=A0A1B1W2C0_9CAUD|nr:hypothetical protein BOW75_gp27 [Salmonella phage IME207]ANW46822.1 hypothetical protein [Salmonella phage IME207]
MTTRYRLLKGSACDFVGAPANVRLAIRHRMDDRLAWCEKLETHATMWEPNKKNAYFIGNKENWFSVGIREPVTGDEQDLNECIGAPEADVKRGGFIANTKSFVGDSSPEGYPALNKCKQPADANKYLHEINPGVFVDVYDVLVAWNVTNPALQHLIKKALQAGERGHKSREQDLQDIIDSAIRAKELESK